mgnify:CR=1 FL=1|tara:strand:+ start:293 stop:796 length:504 start_codon:yes stop_codon:yes gene_type:complete
MWIILTHKKNELNILFKSLKQKLNDNVSFYQPKVKTSSFKNNKIINKSKPLLNDYIFCFSTSFNLSRNLNNIINSKGLKSLVGDSLGSQKEIVDFINLCKKIEDEDGHVKQNMILDIVQDEYYKFTSGPFANLIFKLIQKNKKDLRVLIGKVTTTIDIKNNYNFQLV